MTVERHHRALERMYLAAPINEIYRPRVTGGRDRAEIETSAGARLFHSARAVHDSVDFKVPDDAALFAANSLAAQHLVLTVEFTTDLLRPISPGIMRSVGHVTGRDGKGSEPWTR